MLLHILDLFILALASFRLTRLIVFDSITEFLRRPFYSTEEVETNGITQHYIVLPESGVKRWFGELLTCFWCMGIWCSAFLYLGYLFLPFFFTPILIILAIAAIAALIEWGIQKFE
ncbi:DUF1360 domain-containing protein [Bacillus alkalicellulosilyticus]|uniref:DUF1360 domain-containing protein n=1 Tax=Alkalihalobacterium alkalicellulosilyticum TaxID=1912214 RepID=UPI000996E42C|nr:DUF1360 domain-containing protein [Bacillus alkalicellulosilyticus]